MAYTDLTSWNAGLKELYDGQVVESMVYANNPFLALVEKNEGFGGKYMPVPVIYADGQASSTFSYAQSDQAPPELVEFLITRKKNYSVATIDNETMKASEKDKYAFLQAAKTSIDLSIRAVTNDIATSLFGDGTGTIGQVSGAVSTGVITLSEPSDVVRFKRNQTLQACSTLGGSARAAVGYVVAVDRTAGTVTVSATGLGGSAGTPSGWSDGDYLVVRGNLNNVISGLGAWLPSTAPGGSDSFYGVNRSVDSTRLAGVRYNGASQSIEEALVDGSNLIAREGGNPDYAFVTHASYSALEKALGSKVQYVDLTGPAGIGFRAIRIHGATGDIKVIPDRSCTAKRAYLLQMNTWKLHSLGKAPHIETYGAEGLEYLRVSNADAVEARINSYANLATNAPGWNGVISLGA